MTLLLASGIVMGWIALDRLGRTGSRWLPRWGAWALLAIAPTTIAMSFFVSRWLGPQQPTGPRPASTASIAFVDPSPGETVSGQTLTVRFKLTGGRIVEETTTDVTADTGHIHVSLDGEIVSMTYGLVQVVAIGDLNPGVHRLQAEFVAADHAPFDPRVMGNRDLREGGVVRHRLAVRRPDFRQMSRGRTTAGVPPRLGWARKDGKSA